MEGLRSTLLWWVSLLYYLSPPRKEVDADQVCSHCFLEQWWRWQGWQKWVEIQQLWLCCAIPFPIVALKGAKIILHTININISTSYSFSEKRLRHNKDISHEISFFEIWENRYGVWIGLPLNSYDCFRYPSLGLYYIHN